MSTENIEEKFKQQNQDEKKTNKGGFYLNTPEEEKYAIEQRQAIWSFVKQVGSSLLEGKELTSVPLPVIFFEPKTYFERITQSWMYMDLINKAKECTDPVERFLNVVAFGVGGLHGQVRSGVRKPFNPILGETWQAYFPDLDIPIYFEQTSHHPPISHWEVFGKGWNFKGHAGVYASASVNSLKGQQTGIHHFDFEDTVISYTHPIVNLQGLLWGERVMNYSDSMTFEDKKNNLKLVVIFNPDQLGYFSSWIWSNATPSDTIRGKLEKDGKEIGMIEGSWLGKIEFIDKDKKKTTLWEMEKNQKFPIKHSENPLPSDSRFRKDLIYFKEGDLENSQLWKTKLEEIQRKERKWRQQGDESQH